LAGALDQQALEEAHAHYVGELLKRTAKPRVHAANDTLARHLYGHGEQWFMFLLEPRLPATNWPAEQATRPAVVNRKVWGGNRTEAGAQAHVVSALDYISQSLCGFITSLTTSPALVGER